MKYLLLLAPLFMAACSKSSDSTPPTPTGTAVDTVGRVWLDSYKFATGWDTSGNYIAMYNFSKGSGYGTLAQYTASSSSGTHRVRYVGGTPLFNSDSVKSRGGTLIDFKMNAALKGRPLFEVYNVTTGQLYKTYVASNDSVTIRASFSASDNFIITNKAIGDAFLYYIAVKQNDGILYRKN